MISSPVDRGQIVRTIAGHIADRDSFVIATPPGMLAPLALALRELPPVWTAYLDNGLPLVLRTDQPSALAAVEMLTPATAVVIVPKSIPATVLGEALGQEVAGDGSQDIVLLRTTLQGPMVWPVLFVDAVAIVDPRAAMQIRVSDLAGLS